MKHDELGDVYCPVARTWSVIGERWTMTILRECFRGERRYEPRTVCDHCGEPVRWREMTAELEPGAW